MRAMQTAHCHADLTAAPHRRIGLARAGLSALLAALAALMLAGCASRSADVAARPTDPAAYAAWDCERLFDESDAVQHQAADVAYAVDSVAGNNMIALGLGVTVFWPALLAMRPDGPEAAQLAELTPVVDFSFRPALAGRRIACEHRQRGNAPVPARCVRSVRPVHT